MFYDCAESGGYGEQTFRENVSDFSEARLRQKVAIDMSGRNTATKMAGIGLTGMQCADGEIKAARFGVLFTLSTMSICSIEDVAAQSPDPLRDA